MWLQEAKKAEWLESQARQPRGASFLPREEGTKVKHVASHTKDVGLEEDNEMSEAIDKSLHDPHEFDYPLCDNIHSVERMTFHDLESQLLVINENMLQVLTRTDGAHKFIEFLMWRTHLEERHKGFVEWVTSYQMCILKEELERMKLDYL